MLPYTDILNTIEFIEDSLGEPISLEDAARVSGFSKFHFVRVFQALTDETPFDYIRKRRLTVASLELLNSTATIGSIAQSVGYYSHEAFSRAFKEVFGITPKTYRDRGTPLLNLQVPKITEEQLKSHTLLVSPEHDILPAQNLALAGMAYSGKNDKGQVAKLWNEFYPLVSSLDNRIGDHKFGFSKLVYSKFNRSLFYMAAVEVSNVEKSTPPIALKLLPSYKYARFTFHGQIKQLNRAIQEVYGIHLINQKLKAADDYTLEFYEPDFKPNQTGSKIQLWFPVH